MKRSIILILSLLMVCLYISAIAAPLPYALYLPDQQDKKALALPDEYLPMYTVVYAHCTDSELVYTQDDALNTVRVRATFRPVWLSNAAFSTLTSKPMNVQSSTLGPDGTLPFEKGKKYILFGAITNSHSNPAQFTMGALSSVLHANLEHEGKNYTYTPTDVAAPFFMELDNESIQTIESHLKSDRIWYTWLTMADIHARSLFVSDTLSNKEDVGLRIIKGEWPTKTNEFAVSTLLAEKKRSVHWGYPVRCSLPARASGAQWKFKSDFFRKCLCQP